MKTNVLILLVAMGFLLSCNNEMASEEITTQQSLMTNKKIVESLFVQNKSMNTHSLKKSATSNQVEKIFKVRTEGTMQMVPCDFGENFGKTIVEGEGNATHLGLFTITLSYCFNEEGPVENIFAIQTAANGDVIYSVVVGSNPQVQSLDFYIYDGTGRFMGATGEITLFFDFDYDNGTFSNYGQGTLTY